MAKITYDQMRAMKYGLSQVGCHLHIKLRFTIVIVEGPMQDKDLMRFQNDITVIRNKDNKHAHIGAIVHQSSDLWFFMNKARNRIAAKKRLIGV